MWPVDQFGEFMESLGTDDRVVAGGILANVKIILQIAPQFFMSLYG